MDETDGTGGGGFIGLVADIWANGVFGVDLGRLLLAALILAALFTFRAILSVWLRERLKSLSARTETPLDDKLSAALHEPISYAPFALGAYLAVRFLGLDDVPFFDAATRTLIVIVLFWSVICLVGPFSKTSTWLDERISPELATWIWKAVRFLLYFLGAATVLEIWGVNIVGVLAGFGLIGVAVALGAQDLFKNLISGVLILTEKRLRVGDWVKIDGVVEGTVEKIGFRSVRVRRFDKAPVYVPNAAFADGAVTNFGEMPHRRISWTLGLEYRTSAAQLTAIRNRVEALILDDERYLAPPDNSVFVRLDAFADSSVNLLIYCFTETRDWGEWLKIKEELLLDIKRIVEEEGAGFAFPSQSLYLETTPASLTAPDTGAEPSAPLAAESAGAATRASAPKKPATSKAAAKAAAKPAAVKASGAATRRKAAKPSETKPAETKPAETKATSKPAAQTTNPATTQATTPASGRGGGQPGDADS